MNADLPSRFLGLAAALVVGLAVGYFVRPGSSTAPTVTATASTQKLATPAAPSSNPTEANEPGDSSARARNAIGSALQSPPGLQRQRELLDVITRLRAEEIPALVEMARHLPEMEREELLRLLGAHWAELDPVQAFEFIASRKDVYEARGLGFAAMAVWVGRDQKAAIEWSLARPIGPMRLTILNTLCLALATRDFPAARDVVNRAETKAERFQLAEWLVTAAVHRRDAAELAASLPGGGERDKITRIAFHGWAGEDPAGALAFASQLSTEAGRHLALSAVVGEWAKRDPRAALQAWLDHGAVASGRDITLGQIALEWAKTEPDEAMTWVGALPDTATRDWVLPHMVSTISRTDPQRGVKLAESLPSSVQSDARFYAAQGWARHQPEAAAQWVIGWQDENSMTNSLSMVLSYWLESNKKAATQWIGTLPPGSARDVANASMARRLMFSDPPAAVEWAERVVDVDRRKEAIQGVAGVWLHSDKPRAQAWIEARPELTPKEKAKLLAR